jgi:hypothetical protein
MFIFVRTKKEKVMYYHICKQELCPHCHQISCGCEQLFEDTTAGFKMLCPHCKGIMMQTTVTTTSINLEYYDKTN